MQGKAAYLNRLYSRMTFKPKLHDARSASVLPLGDHVEGSSPPSIFVGRFGYPKVCIGPLVPNQHGDTSILDTPELWLRNQQGGNQVFTNHDVVNFRLQLVRGKQLAGVKEESRTVGKMRDIALAKNSVDIEASFSSAPTGYQINEEHQPFGPSGSLKSIVVGSTKYEPRIEKAYNDTDLKANDAVTGLYEKGLEVSKIQKAFSVGAFGLARNRKLVPTRWSITAVDDILGKNLLANIRNYPMIDSYRVYESNDFHNYFSVLLIPQMWRYEFLEAFIHVFGKEEVLFGDWEPHPGKKGYTTMGGCYYSVRLAVAEQLEREKKQAAALVFRESYSGYIPLGVWLCRETARAAMRSKPAEFADVRSAVAYMLGRLRFPYWKYRRNSVLLKQIGI